MLDTYQDDGGAITNMCAGTLAVTTGTAIADLRDLAPMSCSGPLTSVASTMSSATTCAAFKSAYGSYCTALATCASCSSRRLSEGLEARHFEAQVHVGFSDWHDARDFSDRLNQDETSLVLSWFDESVRTHIAKLRLVSWTAVQTNEDDDSGLSGGIIGAIIGASVGFVVAVAGLLFWCTTVGNALTVVRHRRRHKIRPPELSSTFNAEDDGTAPTVVLPTTRDVPMGIVMSQYSTAVPTVASAAVPTVVPTAVPTAYALTPMAVLPPIGVAGAS